MPRTRYLKPKSVEHSTQGDFTYYPRFFLLEDTTMAGLQSQIDFQVNVDAFNVGSFWVVEEIEYQVTFAPTPMDNDRVIYSCMIWATEVEQI